MKIIELNGQTFIRIGSRTLSPVDAVAHLISVVEEANGLLNEAGFDRNRVRQRYHHAVETGQPFDRAELAEADRKIDDAKAALDVAKNELGQCRHLITLNQAKARVSSSQAELDHLLQRFPAEAA